jgi:hypothetical protein
VSITDNVPVLMPYRIGGGSLPGRVRGVERRFQNDAGWFAWRGVSDLAAVGYELSGRGAEVWARFDEYRRAKKTVVRVIGMLGTQVWVDAALAFGPTTPGYAEARERVRSEANARGLYLEWCVFGDAQVVMPGRSARLAWARESAVWCRDNPGVIPQLVNEPAFNGWSEADDPELLALADDFARVLGHRDFSIGDPKDGDNPDASAETTERLIALSKRARIAVLHPDRSFGSDARWRRWIDHLEGMTDVVHQLAPGCAYVIDEPIGAALNEQPGRRDSDTDAFVAAQAVAICCGFGFTYHKIDSEIATSALPGFFDVDVLADMPVSPDWVYLNDSWPGAPTNGIRWRGKEGKVRNLVRGNQAWTVAYGEGDWNSVVWRVGWTPVLVYDGPRCKVWKVNL